MADLTALPPSPRDQKPWPDHIAPLNDELWQRFNWFRDLCKERFNIDQFVLSGVRTYAQQVALRRQNCGTSDYDMYRKPSSLCTPATAIPGTSNHEVKDPRVGGMAIDCGYGYNDVSGPMIATARECGLRYAVPSEDWHVEIDASNRTPIPEKYTNPTPTPPPSPEDDMATYRDELWHDPRTGAVYLTTECKNADGSFSFQRQATWLPDNDAVIFYRDKAKLPYRDANPTELASMNCPDFVQPPPPK